MITEDKVKAQFLNDGYKLLAQDKAPKNLLWEASLLLSKGGFRYLVLIKSNDSIPPSYLERIAAIPKGNFIALIVFCQRPSITHEKEILSLGISVCHFLKGKISNLTIKKKPPTTVVRAIKRKLSVIDIFLSSKQDIPERKFTESRIEYLRKAYSYPFNPPRLIEYDRFKPADLYTHIDKILGDCEWIIILLEDNYSKVVSYEIKKAILNFDHDNIFMFVKQTITCQKAWKKELTKVKALKSQSIKYLPYADQSELEVCLSRAIRERINEICKKQKIQLFA